MSKDNYENHEQAVKRVVQRLLKHLLGEIVSCFSLQDGYTKPGTPILDIDLRVIMLQSRLLQ